MSDAVARLNAALEGRYAIERELGEGGMATVYLADDLKHERKVALKILKPEHVWIPSHTSMVPSGPESRWDLCGQILTVRDFLLAPSLKCQES